MNDFSIAGVWEIWVIFNECFNVHHTQDSPGVSHGEDETHTSFLFYLLMKLFCTNAISTNYDLSVWWCYAEG